MFDRTKFRALAPIPLRLIVGFGFMEHGFAKAVKGPEAFAPILHALGVPAPHWMAYLTIMTEWLGGFAVLLGAFIPLVSIPMAIVLLTAMFSVHRRYGFSSIKLLEITPAGARFGPPGYECDLLYLACLVALVFLGAGPLSFEWSFRTKALIYLVALRDSMSLQLSCRAKEFRSFRLRCLGCVPRLSSSEMRVLP